MCGCCPSFISPVFQFYSTTHGSSQKPEKENAKKKETEQGVSRVFSHSAPGGKHESAVSFIASWVSIQTSFLYPVTFVVLHLFLPPRSAGALSPSLFQLHAFKSFTGKAFCSYFSIFLQHWSPPCWAGTQTGMSSPLCSRNTGMKQAFFFNRWREHSKVRKSYFH